MPPNTLPLRAVTVLALSAALLLLRLGDVPLLGPDEPRYTRVAVEMQRAGEWVTPTLQGEPWLEKPPLYYWLAGTAFSVLGETEFAARLPGVAAGLLLIGFTALVSARLHGPQAALHTAYVLGTSLLIFAYSRAAAMDMLLAATLSVGIGLVLLRLAGVAGRMAVPAAYVMFALATLAKGPLGFLLPGLVAVVYLISTQSRRHRDLREWVSAPGLLLFVLVAAPWYVAVWLDQGDRFLEVFLLGHNLQRFTSTIHNHPGPFWYYGPIILAGFFPWSGLLLPACARGLRGATPANVFIRVWVLAPLVFFSLAGSKLPGYILPVLPPLAILMGRAAAELEPGQKPWWAGPRAVALTSLTLAAATAALPAALYRMGEPGWRQTLPLCLWALLGTFGFARHVGVRPAAALRLMRLTAAGVLLLLALAAPPILARRESGRALFVAAEGRAVLAWGAWRTAWMAGYFYNDGRVSEIEGLARITEATASGPALVLAGPGERRQIDAHPALRSTLLATGPRGNVLLEVRRRQGP